jgi:hypothetical protein
MSESVFNEGSIDVDFRVEGNGATHAFFVEGETDRVGIGTNDPGSLLELKGTGETQIYINSASGSNSGVRLLENGTSKWTIGHDQSDDKLFFYDFTTTSTIMVIESDGKVGIGTDSPGYQLDLRRNDTGTTTSLGIRQIGTGDASMAFQTTTSPYGFCIGVDGSDSDAFKIATGTDDVGTNTKLSIDNSGDVTISELLYVNNAVNHGRTTAGATFRAQNNGNAAITLLSASNHSAGVGEDIVALNFAANNEWADTKDGVYAQIRCENGNGSYADRGQLVFATAYNGNTIYDRMVINFDGYIGIGTMTPGENVHIYSSASAATTLKIEAATNGQRADIALYGTYTGSNNEFAEILFVNDDDSVCAIQAGRDTNDGNGSIKFVTQAATLSQGMTIRAILSSEGDFFTNDGSVSSLSDKRTKKDIADLEDGLSIINQLKPKTFKYNGKTALGSEDNKTRYGFIADDVLEVASQYVSIGTEKIDGVEVDDFKSLSMIRMFPMLVKAVQELSAKVTALEGN